jgi:hypothetical protein
LIIKTDGVSLTEQLFAMPPEDKDHQGRTRVYISNERQFVNQDSTKKSREEDHATFCILIAWTTQSKEKQNAKERSLLNGPRIKSPLQQIEEQRMKCLRTWNYNTL